MTADLQRWDALQALGLTEWHHRADGPLAAAKNESATDTATLEQASAPGAPAEPASTDSDSMPPAETMADEIESFDDDTRWQSDQTGRLDTLDWPALEAWLQQQDHRGATQPVFGTGAHDADILIVGEAPGANEDAQGLPFVGRAGQLLDRMLCAIGCSRAHNVYITNICKFRPPDNRDPTPKEVATDWPVLERQIALMQPTIVVAVGRIAAQTLLNTREPLGRMRGRLHRYPGRNLDVLVTYHPAFLLRSPARKADAWQDLKMIARHIAKFDEAAS